MHKLDFLVFVLQEQDRSKAVPNYLRGKESTLHFVHFLCQQRSDFLSFSSFLLLVFTFKHDARTIVRVVSCFKRDVS